MRMRSLGLLICLMAVSAAGCNRLSPGEGLEDEAATAEEAGGTESEAAAEDADASSDAGSAVSDADAAEDASESSESDADSTDSEAPGGEGSAAYPGVGAASAGSAAGLADMLGAEEIARAESLALESQSFAGVVAQAVDRDEVDTAGGVGALARMADRPSYRVLYTQRHADKYATSRKAEVAVYRYDTGKISMSTVDLESGEVQALAVPEGFPAPLVPEETREAAQLARGDSQVVAALEAAGLDPETALANGIITVSRQAGARCAEHRCLRLFFSSFEDPRPRFAVIVDLNDLEVVEIETMPGFDAQGVDQ